MNLVEIARLFDVEISGIEPGQTPLKIAPVVGDGFLDLEGLWFLPVELKLTGQAQGFVGEGFGAVEQFGVFEQGEVGFVDAAQPVVICGGFVVFRLFFNELERL